MGLTCSQSPSTPKPHLLFGETSPFFHPIFLHSALSAISLSGLFQLLSSPIPGGNIDPPSQPAQSPSLWQRGIACRPVPTDMQGNPQLQPPCPATPVTLAQSSSLAVCSSWSWRFRVKISYFAICDLGPGGVSSPVASGALSLPARLPGNPN